MRILYVITGLDYGGAEMQVRDIAFTMTRRSHQVAIASLTKPRAFEAELAAASIPVFDLSMDRKNKSVSSFWRAGLALRRIAEKMQADIIHSHMVHANLMARIFLGTRKYGPLICTAHSTTEGGRVRDWAYRITDCGSAVNTTVSKSATTRFLSDSVFKSSNTITIYNGIDTEKYNPRSRLYHSGREFRWISVGRLQEEKDYPTLLAALKQIPEARLDIVGTGDLYEFLVQRAEREQVQDRVRFLGLRKDIAALLRRYDGFVLSSAWEGFALVVAEAMASGLPVVATRSGGPQEIIGEDQRAGLLVPPQDPQSLAMAMAKVMRLSPIQRAQMGKEGRGRIEAHFSLEIVADRWTALYRTLTTKKHIY